MSGDVAFGFVGVLVGVVLLYLVPNEWRRWRPKFREAADELYEIELIRDYRGRPLSPQPRDVQVTHLRGVSWHEAPVPPPWHRCRTQTRGWINILTRFRRCRCGALSLDGGPWAERNSRLYGAVIDAWRMKR